MIPRGGVPGYDLIRQINNVKVIMSMTCGARRQR